MAITVKEAQTLYVSYFGRPSDVAGLKYWTGNETLVGSLEQLAHSFFNSAEGKKYYPINPATNQIDITGSINAIYANMFGRAPETAGFNYWYNEIASGKINLAEAAVAIYKGALGKDAVMIENKIAAATQFTAQVAASGKPSLYDGDQAFAKANEFLKTVTDTTDVTSADFAAQVNAAVNAAEAAGGSSSAGGTFMLTEGVDYADNANSYHIVDGKSISDTFKFTAGDDVVVATSKTLNSTDKLVDLTATDNDVLQLNLGITDGGTISVGTGANAIGSGATIVGIEELDIVSAGAGAVNVTNLFPGIKTLKVSGPFVTSFGFTGAAADKVLTTIDASGVSVGDVTLDASLINQDLTITGPNAAATIKGGSGVDTITGQGSITGGDGNDVITLNGAATVTGGSGNDTITVDAVGAATIVIGAENANGIDTIVGFDATKDKITSNASHTKNATLKSSMAYFASLEAAKDAMAAGSGMELAANGAQVFTVGEKTYVAIDLGTAGYSSGTDAIVEITGYTGTLDDLAKAIFNQA